ncbi:hypothetical protein [Mesorhizobium sp.]|uniref:hypothetical protein n=1 Tax=Mesorhizobium sp. TaxID=1871066 RepID=UPI000FE636B9|nr:hypothetical protein [Mesorhizobium sp.]RWL18070.1 MAG: hypothetical protein EOR57_22150 [Mesorhizobium sp.]TIP74370.1 MAG: hypothetical protein E5X55_09210 [Mesorhizobium sp.]TIQ17729.1 MAG: hypothetical protein E5X51_28995 [Mesorhizobium sp.]TJV95461.1 MAG: hypothetical protein E5X52_24130 [Mesorhizobium sp.]
MKVAYAGQWREFDDITISISVGRGLSFNENGQLKMADGNAVAMKETVSELSATARRERRISLLRRMSTFGHARRGNRPLLAIESKLRWPPLAQASNSTKEVEEAPPLVFRRG